MELLSKYRVFQTADHDDGQQFLSQVWERHHSLLKGKRFALTWNQANLKRCSLAYVDHACGAVLECDGPVSDAYRMCFHLTGRVDHRINCNEAGSWPGQCAVHSPRAEVRLDAEPFSALVLNLDGDFVRTALNQRFSKLPPLETWATAFSVDSPAVATLNSLCLWMAKELDDPQSLLLTQDRVAASFERTLLTLFIECLVERHPSADEIRGDLTNIHVRRAEEWIDAHVKDAIGVEDVASAIGVEAQALVRAFKRVRGYSPTRALRRRRLERARDALAAAGPETTVTTVAIGLGFFELGRFAARYREQFGEKPSETLARSLGRVPEQTTPMQKRSPAEVGSA
jgi:AraC-like DNA-binding protein